MTRLYIGDNVPDDPEFDPGGKKRYLVTCELLIEAYDEDEAYEEAKEFLEDNTQKGGNPHGYNLEEKTSAYQGGEYSVQFLDLV